MHTSSHTKRERNNTHLHVPGDGVELVSEVARLIGIEFWDKRITKYLSETFLKG